MYVISYFLSTAISLYLSETRRPRSFPLSAPCVYCLYFLLERVTRKRPMLFPTCLQILIVYRPNSARNQHNTSQRHAKYKIGMKDDGLFLKSGAKCSVT